MGRFCARPPLKAELPPGPAHALPPQLGDGEWRRHGLLVPRPVPPVLPRVRSPGPAHGPCPRAAAGPRPSPRLLRRLREPGGARAAPRGRGALRQRFTCAAGPVCVFFYLKQEKRLGNWVIRENAALSWSRRCWGWGGVGGLGGGTGGVALSGGAPCIFLI